MGDVVPINDISYIMEGETFVGVVDDKTGISIEVGENGNINVKGGAIPRQLLNNLLIGWLCISNPDVILMGDDGVPSG